MASPSSSSCSEKQTPKRLVNEAAEQMFSSSSMLSIDDLAHPNEDASTSTRGINPSIDMEEQIHSNLLKQQENHARQRKLLDQLRAGESSGCDTTLSVSARASARANRASSISSDLERDRESTQQDNDESLRTKGKRQQKKNKKRPPIDFVMQLQQQEASNDALRKQLELLRLLQLENNRFRHENKTLRDQLDVLTRQNDVKDHEARRLRDDLADFQVQLEEDQVKLASLSQTTRKLKQLQKQLETTRQERTTLEAALQEALETQEAIERRSHEHIQCLQGEHQRLKRALKQATQEHHQLVQEKSVATDIIDQSEAQIHDLESQCKALTRQNGDLKTQLVKKTQQCEDIQASASACVDRMEQSMQDAQRAYTSERDKRKRSEKQVAEVSKELEFVSHEVANAREIVVAHEKTIQEMKKQAKELQKMLVESQNTFETRLNESQSEKQQLEKHVLELKEEIEALEKEKEASKKAKKEWKDQLAQQSTEMKAEVETLRGYIESSIQSMNSNDSGKSQFKTGRESDDSDVESQCEREREREQAHARLVLQLTATKNQARVVFPPPLQYVQTTLGSLQEALLSLVRDYHQKHHEHRAQTTKYHIACDRMEELEQFKAQLTAENQSLQEKAVVCEQARDISVKEKIEILKWSQQTCEKNELLLAELQKAEKKTKTLLLKLIGTGFLKKKKRASSSSKTEEDEADDDEENQASENMAPMLQRLETYVQSLVETIERLQDEQRQQETRLTQVLDANEALKREMTSKTKETTQMLQEIEQLHVKTHQEQQELYQKTCEEHASTTQNLKSQLQATMERLESADKQNESFKAISSVHEQDLKVVTGIFTLLTALLRPMVLQIAELTAQKRFLLKANADLSHVSMEIDALGNQLQELVPGNDEEEEKDRLESVTGRPRAVRRRFRCLAIAVWAANRFQRTRRNIQENENGEEEEILRFGQCEWLTSSSPSCASSSSSGSILKSSLNTAVAVKMMSPHDIKPFSSLRETLDRLRAAQFTQRLHQILDGKPSLPPSKKKKYNNVSPSGFGGLLLEVLMALTATGTSSELMMENLQGVFHSQALLQQEKKYRARDPSSSRAYIAATSGSLKPLLTSKNGLYSVDGIRNRLFLLGQRMEDLQYQRNMLQRDNYALQTDLEQQHAHLRELRAVQEQYQSLKELVAVNDTERASEVASFELALATRENELVVHKQQIQALTEEKKQVESQLAEKKSQFEKSQFEKKQVVQELGQAKTQQVVDEEKKTLLRLQLSKQDDELQAIRAAAKHAHERLQRTTWRLEQEMEARTATEALLEQLKQQHRRLKVELHEETMQEINKSLESVNGSVEEVDGVRWGAPSPSPVAPLESFRMDKSVLEDMDDEDEGEDEDEKEEGEEERKEFRVRAKQIDVNKKKMDVERVNSAVHEYMDKLNEKLHQLYGIPHSERSIAEKGP